MMGIDEALYAVLNTLNSILIPASEAEKMSVAKSNIQAVITAVQNKAKEEANQDDH